MRISTAKKTSEIATDNKDTEGTQHSRECEKIDAKMVQNEAYGMPLRQEVMEHQNEDVYYELVK